MEKNQSNEFNKTGGNYINIYKIPIELTGFTLLLLLFQCNRQDDEIVRRYPWIENFFRQRQL